MTINLEMKKKKRREEGMENLRVKRTTMAETWTRCKGGTHTQIIKQEIARYLPDTGISYSQKG